MGGSEIGATLRATGPTDVVNDTIRALDDTLAEPSGGPGPNVHRGTEIGRFMVLSELGEGAMGVVVAAHDPDLDRKVALKLVRPHAGAEGADQTRLLREAQALAKLSHPNVVAIHDVGVHEGQVWMAMEFVAGRTLGAWANERPRRWPELLRVLTDAARGVAAAHAAGLVHRDLKPDNVMIDDDRRVRVMDFGLAHGRVDPPAAPVEHDDTPQPAEAGLIATIATGSPTGPLAALLTRSGAIQGTPAYMAPEQWRGQEAEPATDQFGWSVMAWELLYGERPFAGDTPMELREAVLADRRRPPRRWHAPRWLRRVLERGLDPEPARRWPSMAALLAALERGRARARLRTAALVTMLLGLLVGGVLGYGQWQTARIAGVCAADGASIAEVWNDDVEARLRAALLATGVSYAGTTADKVVPQFTAQAEAWRVARTEACLDARLRGAWDEDTLDRAAWCLDERRLELDALVDELTHASAEMMQRVADSTAGLSPIGACVDARRLAMLPRLPADRQAVRGVLEQTARATALQSAGKYREGIEAVTAALAAAERVAWPPLIASASLRLGDLLALSGKYPEAEAALERAYFQAAEVAALEVAAAAASTLAWTVGYQQARHQDGFRWARHTDVALAMLGAADDDLWRAAALSNLASLHNATGDYAAARALYARAQAIYEKGLGPDHAHVGNAINNIASIETTLGNYREAQALHERASALYERALGPDHPNYALSLNNLGLVHFYLGEYREAARLYERALAIDERALGTDHPSYALALSNLAHVHAKLGEYAESKALYARAIAVFEKAVGPEHPSVATSLHNLGHVHVDAGEYAEAEPRFARALAIFEKTLGPDHPNVAAPLTGLARVALAQGRPLDAIALAGRALRIREATRATPDRLAETRFALARGLWDAPIAGGRDPARALTLARDARDAYRESRGKERELAEVEAFLAAHPQ